MDNKVVIHSGIKGMKWGRRRFQNPDGTLTEAGKRRYNKEYEKLSDDKKATYKPDVDEWVKKDLRSGRQLSDEVNSATRTLKNQADSSIRNQKKTRMDLSSMSDKEMRDAINRATLEKQYNDMFAPQKSTRGREIASKSLEVAGTVLTLGSTALGIALAIKELKD